MPNILAIETSTATCSIALWSENKIIALKETSEQNAHSRLLTVMINDLFTENHFDINSLNAVAVSIGPGSYTGLRIGVSVTKGLCFGLSIPAITVDTLKALTQQYLLHNPKIVKQKEIIFCPMLDAKRMEVYSAVYTTNLEEILPVSAMIVDETSFHDLLIKKQIIFFGSGAEKCKNIISSPNALFIDDIEPSATGVAILAAELYSNKQFADTAYFEPAYLKDFIAIKSTKKFF
jgi:tRNA threonylcarbamoyladenosine biosynthesis protein TsaB